MHVKRGAGGGEGQEGDRRTNTGNNQRGILSTEPGRERSTVRASENYPLPLKIGSIILLNPNKKEQGEGKRIEN